MMNPPEFDRDSIAPGCSDLHYALLFAPHASRDRLAALFALSAEMDTGIDACTDPGVATRKLDWWHSETGALRAGAPTHPLTTFLVPEVGPPDLDMMEAMLVAKATELEHGGFPTAEALRTHCIRAGGGLFRACAATLGIGAPRALDACARLGCAWWSSRMFRELRPRLMRGRTPLPLDEAGVRELLSGDQSEHGELLARHGRRIQDDLADAIDRAAGEIDARQAPLTVLAALSSRALDEIRRDGYRILAHRIELTPLHKLWLAWRTARTIHKRARPGP